MISDVNINIYIFIYLFIFMHTSHILSASLGLHMDKRGSHFLTQILLLWVQYKQTD